MTAPRGRSSCASRRRRPGRSSGSSGISPPASARRSPAGRAPSRRRSQRAYAVEDVCGKVLVPGCIFIGHAEDHPVVVPVGGADDDVVAEQPGPRQHRPGREKSAIGVSDQHARGRIGAELLVDLRQQLVLQHVEEFLRVSRKLVLSRAVAASLGKARRIVAHARAVIEVDVVLGAGIADAYDDRLLQLLAVGEVAQLVAREGEGIIASSR